MTESQYLDKAIEAKLLKNWEENKSGGRCEQPFFAIQQTKRNDIGIILLFGCVSVLFVIVLILVYIIVYERSHIQQANPSFQTKQKNKWITGQPEETGSLIGQLNTNRLFTANEDVDFIVISLEKRLATHFEVLKNDLAKEGITVTLFRGINGKALNIDDYPMTAQYRAFFVNNQNEFAAGKTKTNYMGHLGATLSHLEVLRNVQNMTVICEDDIDIHSHFRAKFQAAIAAVTTLDPTWDILLLGYTANYNDYHFHKRNDRYPIYKGGIVKIDSWIGGWAYVVRNRQVAQKIVQLLTTPALSWHCDLRLSEENRNGNLNAYACMPTLCDHAGSLRISSWDYTQIGKWATIKSDTNL